MTTKLRLMIYDRTCQGPRLRQRLSLAWAAGSLLYRSLGRLDASYPASGWREALDWAIHCQPERPLAEVQFWGHGRWGEVMLDRQALDRHAFSPGHLLYGAWVELRKRMNPDSRLWLRTCETFGARRGHDFARALAEFFGCRVAGHTYTIGYWQSGLHSLRPGAMPDWSTSEGIATGTPEAPVHSLGSRPDAPHTISCFRGEIPEGW